MPRVFDPSGSRRFGVVLVLVVTNVMLVAIVPASGVSRLLWTILSGVVALAAMWAAGVRPRRQRIVRALVAAATIAAAVALVTGGSELSRGLTSLWSGAFVLLAPLVLVRGLVRHVQEQGVDLRAVAGALAVYMMTGLFFGYLIAGISELSAARYFVQPVGAGPEIDVYFSFVTLTTIGYGDYTPALGIGRGLSILEGVGGQVYLVTVVGLLIGNMRGRRTQRTAAGAGEADVGAS